MLGEDVAAPDGVDGHDGDNAGKGEEEVLGGVLGLVGAMELNNTYAVVHRAVDDGRHDGRCGGV